jgi:hypothetical protein
MLAAVAQEYTHPSATLPTRRTPLDLAFLRPMAAWLSFWSVVNQSGLCGFDWAPCLSLNAQMGSIWGYTGRHMA